MYEVKVTKYRAEKRARPCTGELKPISLGYYNILLQQTIY
jgi:hypothetical protein